MTIEDLWCLHLQNVGPLRISDTVLAFAFYSIATSAWRYQRDLTSDCIRCADLLFHADAPDA